MLAPPSPRLVPLGCAWPASTSLAGDAACVVCSSATAGTRLCLQVSLGSHLQGTDDLETLPSSSKPLCVPRASLTWLSVPLAVTEMLVNILNICSDDELISDGDETLEGKISLLAPGSSRGKGWGRSLVPEQHLIYSWMPSQGFQFLFAQPLCSFG